MHTKTLLTITLIAILPFGARADWVGPVEYSGNDPVVANYDPPYETLTIENDDKQHIASTAYVKGAYNDSIAAINTLNEIVSQKQQGLYSMDTGDVMNGGVFGRQTFIDAYEAGIADDTSAEALMVSAPAVAKLVDVQRVKIYTTWDDDSSSATAEVPLVVASGQ